MRVLLKQIRKVWASKVPKGGDASTTEMNKESVGVQTSRRESWALPQQVCDQAVIVKITADQERVESSLALASAFQSHHCYSRRCPLSTMGASTLGNEKGKQKREKVNIASETVTWSLMAVLPNSIFSYVLTTAPTYHIFRQEAYCTISDDVSSSSSVFK